MQHLVKDKRFLLIKLLAESIDWPDVAIHEEMLNGFGLVGEGARSNVFEWDPKPCNMTPDELMKKSKFIRPAILGKVTHMDKPEYLDELNEVTRAEAESKGWLNGPMSFDQVCSELGDEWLPVQRFAVRQKNKLRPIDNFAQNCVNEAWTAPEKVDLHAMDQLTWVISVFYKASAEGGCIDIPLKDGSRLRGKVHDSWTRDALACEVTTLDLKDAYKQFGIRAEDRNKAVVCLVSGATGMLALISTP